MEFWVVIPAGPIPIDDYVIVDVRDASFNGLLIRGRLITLGALTVKVVLGLDDEGVATDPVRFLEQDQIPVAVQAFQYHANGTLVDQSIQQFGIYRWNPTGALHHFIAAATGRRFPSG